ncbi:MAG: CPBP family intramembrane metalloprotease [Nitrospirae bacterium]|nr:CPBP family intramembrane metalloprotease [Nitrospirota bacterium]
MMVAVYHAFSFSLFRYLIPAFLLTVPIILAPKIHLVFRKKDILLGIAVSAAILLPFWYILFLYGKNLHSLSASSMLFQFLGISFPEEVYFRGYLQEGLGNNVRALLIVSMLFAVIHIPRYLFYGDVSSLLVFFPSLVMGFLYMHTSNVLSSTVFHFFSNVIFLGLAK